MSDKQPNVEGMKYFLTLEAAEKYVANEPLFMDVKHGVFEVPEEGFRRLCPGMYLSPKGGITFDIPVLFWWIEQDYDRRTEVFSQLIWHYTPEEDRDEVITLAITYLKDMELQYGIDRPHWHD